MENHLGKDNRSADEGMGMAHFQDHLLEKKGSLLDLRTFWVTCFLFLLLLSIHYAWSSKGVLKKSVDPFAEVLLLKEKKPS
ncbi:hypothetical protein O0555_16820 [Brevibacillus laterosporus]|uniref:hypothetical protein n=1 Tax=Brevibacillus laterosporus TaxID=1465 RepID=UPI0015E221B0|nr:hypothetical protein [Brevibacillus laterosporus]MCR8938996.1 hypothetical protein [Brevibacillus laterosporus]MCZ0841636.1 hypothetical protein [Brevibacillus laterosporus]MCZ0845352.1 hypothetical protein [Brevibacillus laterosporus]MED1913187.1 hypothetical protein [Brevibacillus laterosporus]